MPRLTRIAAFSCLALVAATRLAVAGPLGDFAERAYEATRRANQNKARADAEANAARAADEATAGPTSIEACERVPEQGLAPAEPQTQPEPCPAPRTTSGN